MKAITLQREQIISIDDLRRKFGEIKKHLPFVTYIITDRGKEIAELRATREMKRSMMKSTVGAFKATELDDDQLWKDVLTKRSRKSAITL